jgi:ABC-2 type transport system permease protein
MTVTLWEYRRFFKIKNELIGILVMLLVSGVSYFGGTLAVLQFSGETEWVVLEGVDEQIVHALSNNFDVRTAPVGDRDSHLETISASRKGALLMQNDTEFEVYAWKKPSDYRQIQDILDEYTRNRAIQSAGLTHETIDYVTRPAMLETVWLSDDGTPDRSILGYAFGILMIMAVFLSFAYQFTAITGEKQLKITEQIVSAVKPQVWMDGKILGITLTGLSSMLIYSILGVLGGILLIQFRGLSLQIIRPYLHLPSIAMFFVFTLMGIMLWNALLAAVASVITDPNNSGKSSLMMTPVLFVLTAFLVVRDADTAVSVFLSWFPLTSATAMPVRFVMTDVVWWELAGSFALLTGMVWLLRKLAAKIFRVSILISGKEPTWTEILKQIRETV